MGGRAGGGASGGMGKGSRGGGDASMRHMSSSMQKVLKAEEEAIRRQGVEHGLVMDDKGNIVWKGTQNKKNRVVLGASITDRITVHNHPGGSSFSKTDLMNAAKGNELESRVVTSKYTYSIKRPKEGWRKGGWVGDKFYSNNALAYKKAKAIVDKRVKQYYSATKGSKSSYPRVNSVYWHLVNKEYAKMQGYTYTKTKIH
jgi:hypothetical protein